jgi:hypothetical protein
MPEYSMVPPDDPNVRVLDPKERDGLNATLDQRNFSLLFVVDQDGNMKTFVPEGTPPGDLLEVRYGSQFTREYPLRRGINELVNQGSVNWILAHAPNPGGVCYWWSGGRCYCCGAH